MNLTPDETVLLCGLLATYRSALARDLERGGLTPEGEARYIRDLTVATALAEKLMPREIAA